MTIMEFSEKLHEFCGKQEDCEYCPLFHVSCYTDLTKEGIEKTAKIIFPPTYKEEFIRRIEQVFPNCVSKEITPEYWEGICVKSFFGDVLTDACRDGDLCSDCWNERMKS